jgi:hypothetical protein
MQTLAKILERIGENLAWVARMYGAPVDPRMLQRRQWDRLERKGSVPWRSRG